MTQAGEVSKALGANVADPHRVPILATCVQEELEKEVVMESTPCSTAAQVSCVPRISRDTYKDFILFTFDFESSGTCHQVPLLTCVNLPLCLTAVCMAHLLSHLSLLTLACSVEGRES